jgi:hypothetical protein
MARTRSWTAPHRSFSSTADNAFLDTGQGLRLRSLRPVVEGEESWTPRRRATGARLSPDVPRETVTITRMFVEE